MAPVTVENGPWEHVLNASTFPWSAPQHQDPRAKGTGARGQWQETKHSAGFLSILRVESGDGLCLQMAQYLAEQFISMLVSEANRGKYCHASLNDGDVF